MPEIYIGNLDSETTEDDLRKIVEPYGVVTRVTMPRDSGTGKVRGFAYITMVDEDDAAEAVELLNGSELRGRQLVVDTRRKIVGLMVCPTCGKAKPVLYTVLLRNPAAATDPEAPLFSDSIELCEDCREHAEEIFAARKKTNSTNR